MITHISPTLDNAVFFPLPVLRDSGFILLAGGLMVELTNHMALGFSLMFLGACGGMFQKFESEAGLWMLSALFAAMTGVILMCFVFGTYRDIAQHALSNETLGASIEVWIAITLLLYQFLFLVQITKRNWMVSKRLAASRFRIGFR